MPSVAFEIYRRAIALRDRLPVPQVCHDTETVYRSTMKRMLTEDGIDPLRDGDACDTYYGRRAALHAGTWFLLDTQLRQLELASARNDRKTAELALGALNRLVERCAPAIDRDPPMERGGSAFAGGPSRWSTSEGAHPRRAKGSKKHQLKHLPATWTEMIWRTAVEQDFAYIAALAVHVLTPVRPAEFVPGRRNGRTASGVEIALVGSELVIGVSPVKSHSGKYGTGETSIRIDAGAVHPAVTYLVALCEASGGKTLVVLPGTNPMRKALKKLGHRAFPDVEVAITGYMFRHQYLADLKATVGAGRVVAAAAGHCTDRTQSHYGRVEHGRRRPEFVGVRVKRVPTAGNVARARLLARRLDPTNHGSVVTDRTQKVTPRAWPDVDLPPAVQDVSARAAGGTAANGPGSLEPWDTRLREGGSGFLLGR